MRVGDKVRLLRGTEEGVIVSINGNIVEIEIEDGFTIPTVKNEVVVINKKESEAFQIEEVEEPVVITQKQLSIPEGIYLGFEDGQKIGCSVVNQTSNTILYSMSVLEKKNFVGFAHGSCNSYDAIEVGETTINQQKGEIQLHIQVICYEDLTKMRKAPIEANLTVKKSQLKDKIHIHSLDKDVSMVNLEKIVDFEIDADKLREKMIGGGSDVQTKMNIAKSKYLTIDLHHDPDKTELPENEILRSQLELFDKSYDQAILSNAESLKVIHGIGSGKLRSEIHKRLSRKKEVKFFEDGDKEKFGFGSTIIYF